MTTSWRGGPSTSVRWFVATIRRSTTERASRMADIIELIYADHDWLRRQFFRLDDARSKDELAAVWNVLSMRLDAHADAEETVFYPALLKHGGRDDPGNPEGDPEDETEDAITDHNAIRDAVRLSRRQEA